MNILGLFSLAALGVSSLSSIAALLYAATKLSSHRSPARWLMLGIFMWLFGGFLSLLTPMMLGTFWGPNDLAWFSMIMSLVRSCLYAAGLVCVVRAVFVDRDQGPRSHGGDGEFPGELPTGFSSDAPPPSNNPFSSPRTS